MGHEIMGTYPSMSHPANRGRICVRGWHVHEVAGSPDRLRQPMIKRNGQFEPVGWDEAYDYVADRLQEIRHKHGPDALGFLNSARCANEDSYLLQKFARAVIGTNNVDQGTSLFRTNSIKVLLDMLGAPAATNSIGELMNSQVIVVSGIDLGQQLPTIGGWVIRAKLAGAKIIAIDARRHRVTESADLLLQIRPGTEVFLYGAMAKVIVDRGMMNRNFIKTRCGDYDKFLKNIESFDALLAAERCGVPAELIEQAAIAYAAASTAMILYSTGAEASGMEPIQSMVNLALLTGNLGKRGAGIMPLAEHNNLQGGCDMGMLPDYFPGYQPVKEPLARAKFERLWEAKLPDRPGLETSVMLGRKDRIRAMWLDRHNPVVSATFCDAKTALESMEFVVLQNLFMTRTAELAHAILPVAAYGEEQVSFTSTERRIQLAKKVVEPSMGLVSAWQQLVQVANRLGSNWKYNNSSDVMKEIGRAVPFYEAANYDNLAREYGRQWPCTNDRPLGTTFLFEEARPHRPFKFVPVHKPSHHTDNPPAEFPFTLTFGHSLYYWHQNALIQHSETLKREYRILLLDYPDGFVEINPADADTLRIRDGAKIRLVSGNGSATTAARVTEEVRKGMVYVPYFLQDISKQLLGHMKTENHSGTKTVWVRIEKA
jgi:predicted molibdopterin-dependent oxidoreductase YjgC